MTKEEFEECLYDTFKARYPDDVTEILEAYIQYHNDLGLGYLEKSPRYIIDNLHDNSEFESLNNCINYHKNINNDTYLYDKLKEAYEEKLVYSELERIVLDYNDNVICLSGKYKPYSDSFEDAISNLKVVYSFGV